MQLRIASAPAGLAVLQRIDLGYFYSESEMGLKSELPWAKYLVLAPDDETVDEIDATMIVP